MEELKIKGAENEFSQVLIMAQETEQILKERKNKYLFISFMYFIIYFILYFILYFIVYFTLHEWEYISINEKIRGNFIKKYWQVGKVCNIINLIAKEREVKLNKVLGGWNII